MIRKRRSDAQHLDDAQEHLRVLRTHLKRGGLDDALIRDAVSHRLEVAFDAVARISPERLRAEAPTERVAEDRRHAEHACAPVRGA